MFPLCDILIWKIIGEHEKDRKEKRRKSVIIEEVAVHAGSEKTVQVRYTPLRSRDSDAKVILSVFICCYMYCE
jgi:hypothetical protein